MRGPVVVGFATGLAVVYLTAGFWVVALCGVTGLLLMRLAVRGRPARRRVRRRRVWTEDERKFILERDGWACVDCGGRDQLEIDHVIPFSRGGACSVENAAVRCRSCNARKGAS